MKKYIYIVYEIDQHKTKNSFCIKGLSTSKTEAKHFFKEHKKDYKKDWFLIFGKVESGNFDIFSNIINEVEILKESY
jgi:hypothetical protein